MKNGIGTKIVGGFGIAVDVVRGVITLGQMLFGKKPPKHDEIFPEGTKTERELREMERAAGRSMVSDDEAPSFGRFPAPASVPRELAGNPSREDTP